MPMSPVESGVPALLPVSRHKRASNMFRWSRGDRHKDGARQHDAEIAEKHTTQNSRAKSETKSHPTDSVEHQVMDEKSFYAIPLPVPGAYDSFTSSVRKSLATHGHVGWDPSSHVRNVTFEGEDKKKTLEYKEPSKHSKSTIPKPSLTPLPISKTMASLEKPDPVNTSRKPKETTKKQKSEAKQSKSFTDRRKLKPKDLKLELSTAFGERDCEMKRSSSSKRSVRGSYEKARVPDNVVIPAQVIEKSEEPVEEKQTQASTVGSNRISLTHNLASYFGSFALPTPPPSTQRHISRTIDKDKITYLTPPPTPSKVVQQSPNSPSPLGINNENQPNNFPRSPTKLQATSGSRIASRLSEHPENENSSTTERSSSPQTRQDVNSQQFQPQTKLLQGYRDDMFENPRQLNGGDLQANYSKDASKRKSVGFPLSQLAKFAEPSFAKQLGPTYSIRDTVLPVIMIANAFGFPHKASVQSTRPFTNGIPATITKDSQQIQQTISSSTAEPKFRGSLQLKTDFKTPSRPVSRSSTNGKSIRNNPYSYSNISCGRADSAMGSHFDDGMSSVLTYDSSVENINMTNMSTSAPVSAFDDDSSDDDYFGDLMQLPGISGMRNRRRKKAGSRKASRDALFRESSLTPDRPFSRLSLSSRHDQLDSPRESTSRRVSTENFVPVRQMPIPEEEEHIPTPMETLHNVKSTVVHRIRDNEVLHLKDSDGYDHLVLEQEDGKTVVVSGTFECLVNELCGAIETSEDDVFADVFLRAALLFTTPLVLLKAVIIRFRQGNFRLQERVLLIVGRWLRTQPEDLLDNEIEKEMLAMFLGEVSCWGQQQQSHRLARIYSQMNDKVFQYAQSIQMQKQELLQSGQMPLEQAPISLQALLENEGMLYDVAQYLSILDMVLFRDASHSRTVCLWWTAQSESEKEAWNWNSEIPYIRCETQSSPSERMNRLLRRTVDMSFWVQVEILTTEKIHKRSKLISRCIQLAMLLREHGNFQSCLTIVDALASETILKLEKTWNEVPIELVRHFSELRSLLDQKVYISVFSKCKDFAVPYFPFFVKAIATLLNQSAHSNIRYNDASKTHIDAQLDLGLHRSALSPSSPNPSSNTAPVMLDFKKYRAFVTEIAIHRSRVKFAPTYIHNLSRKSYALRRMELGRMAFPRDAISGNSNERPRNASTASLQEETNSKKQLESVAEIIETRMEHTTSSVSNRATATNVEHKQQLAVSLVHLLGKVKGEALTPFPAIEDYRTDSDYFTTPSNIV